MKGEANSKKGRIELPQIIDGRMYCPNYPECPGVIDFRESKNGRKYFCSACGMTVHAYRSRRCRDIIRKITFFLSKKSK